MPISNSAIKQQVKTLLESTNSMEQSASADAFSQGMADIIEQALKSALVSVTVTTTGSATAQAGGGQGSLS